MIEFCREHFSEIPNIEFAVSDIRRLSETDSDFDRIRCARVLHHLSADETRCALAELLRVLRSGGILVLAEPVWEGFEFSGSHTDFGSAVRIDMIKDFKQHDLKRRLADWISEVGFHLRSVSAMSRHVSNLEDFNLFYGFQRSLDSVCLDRKIEKAEFMSSLEEQDSKKTFSSVLPFYLCSLRKDK
jgi:SAM-dependent methyltransferase